MAAHYCGLPEGGAGFRDVAPSKPSLCPIWTVCVSSEKGINIDIRPPKRDGRVAVVKIHFQIQFLLRGNRLRQHVEQMLHERRQVFYFVRKSNSPSGLTDGFPPTLACPAAVRLKL